MLIAVSVAGTVMGEVTTFSQAIEERGSGVTEEIETDLQIINDANESDAIVAEENVSVLVKNIGSTDVPAASNHFDIVVDGTFIADGDLEVEVRNREADEWRPGDVIELTVTDPPELEGDSWVTVIVNGNEDRIDFHV